MHWPARFTSWLPTLFALAGTVALLALAAWTREHRLAVQAGWTNLPACDVDLIRGEARVLFRWAGLPKGDWFGDADFYDRDTSAMDFGGRARFDWHLRGQSLGVAVPLLALVPLLWIWPGCRAWKAWRHRPSRNPSLPPGSSPNGEDEPEPAADSEHPG